MGLETFPLLDAFQHSGTCPFCRLADKLERGFMQEYLDELVMDFEYRGRIEKFGLCARHLNLFYAGHDKLGLALTLQSMLSTVRRSVGELKAAYVPDNAAEGILQTLKSHGLRGTLRGGTEGDALERFETYAGGRKCVACQAVTAGLERYAATTVQAFVEDLDFQSAYESAPGLCLPHFVLVAQAARKHLRRSDFNVFFRVTLDKMERDLDKVDSEVARFVRAHDYRFSHEPWEPFASSVRDAVNRFAGFPSRKHSQKRGNSEAW